MLGGLTPEEDAIVDRAISETYALKDIVGDADFTNAAPASLSDFEQVLSGMEGERLARRAPVEIYARHLGRIYESADQYRLETTVCRLSVRDMEDELKPIAMYIITHYIWNAVRHEMKKRFSSSMRRGG